MPKFPELKADEIVAVNPMTGPSAIPFVRRDLTDEEKKHDQQIDEVFALVEAHWKSMQLPLYDTVYEAGACPRCGAPVRYWVARYNGHRHIQCGSTHCIDVME